MQEPEKKPRHAAKHAAPVEEPKPVAEELGADEYELLGDEGDIPLRIRKKSERSSRRERSSKASRRRVAGRKKTRSGQLFSEKKFKRRRSIFEIMSASGEDGLFKPLHIFGHEIRFWPLFLLALFFLLVGMVILNNGNVQAVNQSVTVVGLPDELKDMNILVISDMNGKRFGDQQSALIRAVENLDYDIILCMGDMVGKDGDPEPFYEFLDGISSPSRVYFVCGDSDPGPFVESPRNIQGTLEEIVLEDWILGAVARGATYVDVPMKIEINKSYLWLTPTNYLNLDAIEYREDWLAQMQQEEDGVITGLSSDYNTLPFTSYRYAQAEKFYAALKEIQSTDVLIGLNHIVPDDDFIRSASTHDDQSDRYLFEPELIISGHYCGGVWHLPFLGAFYVPNQMLPRYGWFPAQEDVSGLSLVAESQVYISGGLSTTSAIPVLPFRLLNDPEINLLTLTAELPESMLDEN